MNEQKECIQVKLTCGVDYYKGEKPIKGVDYFTEEDIREIAEYIETEGIDLTDYATKEYVDEAVSGVVVEETDPTVPNWAKQENKPSYSATEVGALPADTVLFSEDYEDLTNKPTIPTVPTNISAFTNDSGYLTSYTETDPTVPSWAKQANKPTYTANEVGALPDDTIIPTVPTNVSAFTNDAGYLTSHQDLTGYATESYVASAIAAIPSATYTFTNGLSESNGTVSWDLSDRIAATTRTGAVIIGSISSTTNTGVCSLAEGNNNNI